MQKVSIWAHPCQGRKKANPNKTITYFQGPLLFGVRRDLMRVTSEECTLPIIQISQTAPLTAPRQRLIHTNPRSAACAISTAQNYHPNVWSNSSSGNCSASTPASCNNRSCPASALRIVRVDVGGRELDAGELGVSWRDNKSSEIVAIEKVVDTIVNLIPTIHDEMFAKSTAFQDAKIHQIDTRDEFAKQFEREGGGGFVLAHWDGTEKTDAKIRERTKATIRCIPLESLIRRDGEPQLCVMTGKTSRQRIVFAKAY